jgi:hypothetical protein
MLQHCRITGIPDTPGAPINPSDAPGYSASAALSTALPTSECEWRPFDLVQKRSGPHNLSRSGYDEESRSYITKPSVQWLTPEARVPQRSRSVLCPRS